ncbi:MAG: hypothetical protein JWN78_401 [Bacteroidota bacterium]|nr:hypothetical protein [Bacteroidota bacterium]
MLALLIACLSLPGCSGLHFSQSAYCRDKQIVKTASALIDKSGDNYSNHQTEVTQFQASVNDALAEEKKRGFNHITVKMFESVIKDKGNVFDLLKIWQTQGTLSPAFKDAGKPEAERLLNTIAELEKYKKKDDAVINCP